MEVKTAVQRVAVLDVDGLPTMYGNVIGHASIVYAPSDGSARRLESRAVVELDEHDAGYLEGRRAYISAIVAHPDCVRPVEDGARVDVRPPAGGSDLPPTTDGIHIGHKFRGRGKPYAGAVVEVFGVSHNHVAYVWLAGASYVGAASLCSASEFYQKFTRV